MVLDPCEAMGRVVAQELSLLQACSDEEMLMDALAIAEAEQQRASLHDRLEAAFGLRIRIWLEGESLHGTVIAVGAHVVVLESDEARVALAVASILSVEGLPHALRRETDVRRSARTSWSAVLRESRRSASVRITLIDGRCLRASVESVGGDHCDIRAIDGTRSTLLLSALRSVISCR